MGRAWAHKSDEHYDRIMSLAAMCFCKSSLTGLLCNTSKNFEVFLKKAGFKLVHLAMTCCLLYFRSKQLAVEVAVDVEWQILCDFSQASGMLWAAGNAKVN